MKTIKISGNGGLKDVEDSLTKCREREGILLKEKNSAQVVSAMAREVL